jgi:hypothetical protein
MRDFVGIPARIDEFYASDEAFVGTMIEIADRGEKKLQKGTQRNPRRKSTVFYR